MHYSSLSVFLELMRPHPSPFTLIRLGGDQDGAYLLPNDLEGIQACFSPGVNNFKDFEDELALRYGIPSHMCDFSSDVSCLKTPLVDGLQTFEKKWLDPDDGSDSISLDDWVDCYCPNSSDLILQMDIEGAEYRNLLAARADLLVRFRIIVIELHWILDSIAEGEDSRLYALLRKLGCTHRIVHAHPNNCCGEYIESSTGINMPNVIELTLLRLDRFAGNEAEYFQPLLPHPLDISRNVLFLPPVNLSPQWLSSRHESSLSAIKRLEDKISYLEYQLYSLTDDADCLVRDLHASIVNLYRHATAGNFDFEANARSQRLLDVAKGKPFFLSQAYMGFSSHGVVQDDPFLFFHTALGRNQSITIDLLDSFRLEFLIIQNRGDCYPERAANLFYCIHDELEFSRDDLMPLIVSREFVYYNGQESITPLLGVKGRFLSIYSPVWTAIHFASIRIMAQRSKTVFGL